VLASHSRVRSPAPRALAALLAALAVSQARAQVQAPTLVEEDLPQEDAKGRPVARPGEPVPEPVQAPPEPAPPPSAAPTPAPARPQAAPAPAAGAMPGVTISTEELRRLQRPIDPVRADPARIPRSWQERRQAVREQDPARARAAAEAIRDTMRELGILNLPTLAVAEVREAERALQARAVDDALAHASFAAEVAPDLPAAHLAHARARLAKEPTRPLPALAALGDGIAAAAREPHTVRALVGDLAGAALAALFASSAALIVLLFASRLRIFLHDFHHLPVVRAGTPVQAAVLAFVILSLPLVFRLGPFAALLAAAVAVWMYLSTRERVAATVALVALVALPWLTRQAAAATAWQGTLADEVHELEYGEGSPELAASLAARAGEGGRGLPGPAMQALGRWHKRRGALDEARRWYEWAAAASPRSAGIQVNLGNVLFLQGNLEEAKAAYLAATDRAGSMTALAAAHYDLSKLYLRLAAVEQSTEARKKAQQEDGAYLARHGSDDDFRANLWLVDVVLPIDAIAALAAGDPGPGAVEDAVRRRVFGPQPAAAWPLVPLLLVAALWGLALLADRLDPSRACERCGRPACRRCDGAAAGTCGQCLNVFFRQNVVEARDRLRKEAQVRSHARWQRLVARGLAVAGGGAGHVVSGHAPIGFLLLFLLAFLGFSIWFWQGVLPPPQSSPYAAALKLTFAVPLFVALYALAVRDAFRRTRPE
jgi:tetratricopeptide (TPR) repeat protein